ncbi:MAG: hypothetical protein K6C05_07305 [Anaerovibrio sp.]|uniref:hypothetical protein n=1 Tax=Anaerovibrio sp. TaxID=1872532 RepID=UPI0025F371F2|nr:hypothetical protein [Anaerovibrio sp.]MCR5176645.1 hypothetical protein [Anaerovibrio sp.]
MKQKIYAYYRGDKNICDGTIREIQKKTGLNWDYLQWMKCPIAHRRNREHRGACLVYIGEE